MQDLMRLQENELERIINNAKQQLEERRNAKRLEVTEQIRELAKSVGLVVMISKKKEGGRPFGKVPPKYRHPGHPEMTWAGRGMEPVWLRDLINEGYTLDELRIAA
jgi:DNA-binding protein H-NS